MNAYRNNLIENLAYDVPASMTRKARTNRNCKNANSTSWKSQTKTRSQWARHKGCQKPAKKFDAVLADEAAELREWNDLLLFECPDPAEDANDDQQELKDFEMDEHELAYWESVFLCA